LWSALCATSSSAQTSIVERPASAGQAGPSYASYSSDVLAGAAEPCAATGAKTCADLGCGSRCRSKCAGIEVGGWIDAGVSAVGTHPTDRYNGVVTFDDRDGEPQMNQLWMFLHREADTGGCGWATGGRVDFIYGTDARFTQCTDGLEANWDQTERFYQVALPQFYVDVAYNDLTISIGHFFTLLGYEVVPAPDNFFYSHSYTMQYCEPFTHTGIMSKYKLSDQWTIHACLHRGIDQFDDTDGHNTLGFLGGAAWTSRNERVSLAFNINASEQNRDIDLINYNAHVVDYSLVGIIKLTDRWTYVVQHDWLQNTAFDTPTGDAIFDGYGLNQYLLYEINEQWSAGTRIEWFRDEDGELVRGLGDGNVAADGGFAGSFYEITLGLDWKPRKNVIVRPEVRWDWFEPRSGVTVHPFDSGRSNDQFLFGCDLIVSW
jgi:hypothetical protein